MLEPDIGFREPVTIEPAVVATLCRLARRGYEAPGKQETFGFLFGSIGRDHRLVIRRAVPYRGGTRTRTGVSFSDWSSVLRVIRSRRAQARRLGMRFLGGFHSHVEIAGKVFRGLSAPDRHSLSRDPEAVLEAIVFVWAGGRAPSKPSDRTIAVTQPATGYGYRLRVYAKRAAGIRQCRARVRALGTDLLL